MKSIARWCTASTFVVSLGLLGACANEQENVSEVSQAASPSPNDQAAFEFFVGKGLQDFQAAGIVGNLDQESQMRPDAVEPGGPGRGIAQWGVGARWDHSPGDNVLAYASQKGESPWSLQLQLEFVWYELESFEAYGLGELRAATNVADATKAFQNLFERCRTSSCHEDARIQYAQDALNAYGGLFAHRNETQVIAIGLDDMLYHDLRHPDGSWSGYGAMGFGADEVAIAGTRNGETQVVAVGWDTVVYHNLRHADGSWTGFAPILKDGANFSAKGVAIAGTPNGETQVVAIGQDYMLYHNLRHADGSWSGYNPMGFGADQVAIAGTRDGETQVVVVGWDETVYHNLRHGDGSWTGFAPLLRGGAKFGAKRVAIAGTPNGESQVVAIGQDRMLYHNLRHADGNWEGYNPMGFGANEVTIAGTSNSEAQIVVTGLDGMVYHELRHTDGSWTTFQPVLRGDAKFGAKKVGIAGL